MPTDSATLANLTKLPVSGVVVEDGIDRGEAQILAAHYFFDLLGIGCGGVRYLRETHDSWIFQTPAGYPVQLGPDIFVRKNGSVVYRSDGPDLYYYRGSWVYDKRKDPKAELEAFFEKLDKERASKPVAAPARP